jgi:ribosome-associated protein
LARLAANAIFAKKGTDIVLLDVEELFALSDVFVVATGTSRPHVQSLAEGVVERLAEEVGLKPIRSEGVNEAEWILLDYGDIIVHLFQGAAREFYGLERLWADSGRVEWNEPVVADG